MIRRRVLVVQLSFQPPGGGNGVAAWVLHALQDRHQLGVLTWTPLDIGEINRFYGTAIREAHLDRDTVPAWVRRLAELPRTPLALFRNALLQRRVRTLSATWDVLISVNNEFDFGRPGIQYIHYPTYQRPRPLHDARWYHGSTLGLTAYYRLAERLGDTSFDRISDNLTLVNSDWTGQVVKSRHGIEPTTVYPPIHNTFEDVPWEQRRIGFLCIGRISPEKRIAEVIDILSIVRKTHPQVSLRIIGTRGRDDYGRRMTERIRGEGAWVTLDENLPRDALLKLLPTYRFGIHGMVDEHFGMAPAEMAAAGCVVFVPRDGGQVEIVDDDEQLTYRNVEEAATKIVAVLDSQPIQKALSSRLRQRAQRFAVERFLDQIRAIVDEFPRGNGSR